MLTAQNPSQVSRAEQGAFATAVSSIQKLVDEIDERVVVTLQDEKNVIAESVLSNGCDKLLNDMQRTKMPPVQKKYVRPGKNMSSLNYVDIANHLLSMICAPDTYHKEVAAKRRALQSITEKQKRVKISTDSKNKSKSN